MNNAQGYDRIWIPTHGTDEMFDEWTVERYADDDIEYIRADIAEAISDQLADAHERIDELLAERAELLAETERLRALVEGE